MSDPELVDFLLRNPYCSCSFLERAFGEEILSSMIEDAKFKLEKVEIKGSGICYAVKKEPSSTLVNLRRIEYAREYALRIMGKKAVYASISPGYKADGEFIYRDKWWRIWVDPGGCAPEALGLVRSPPDTFSPDVIDVVLTNDRERLDLLVHQIQANWIGAQEVLVVHFESNAFRIARPHWSRSEAKRWVPWRLEEIISHIQIRRKGEHKRSLLGELAKELDQKDLSILIALGNFPLLTDYELAYVFSDEARTIKSIITRIKSLSDLGLIEIAHSPVAQDHLEKRKVLTSLGLEILAAHWNISVTNMQMWQSWPQCVDKKEGRPYYRLGWLRLFEKDYDLVRKFCLSLIYGSRCVTSSICDINTRISTTISSKFLFRNFDNQQGSSRTGIAFPDGLISVSFSKRGWVDGRPSRESISVSERRICLEVDRNTIPLTRIETKLDGYANIWPAIKHTKTALVWVIDGSPHRESRIIKMMSDRGIEGWSVTRNRLCISKDDKWWLIHSPASLNTKLRVALKYEAIGGMAPWRTIWLSTNKDGQLPFLGEQPWLYRELIKSPKMEEYQSCAIYKGG